MAEPSTAELAQRELARRELARRGVAVAPPPPAVVSGVSRRGTGSSGGIDSGPPAGETDTPQQPGLLERAANVVTGADRQTAETESADDIALMPEMRAATISSFVPALGGVVAPAVVTAEGALRQIANVVKGGKDPEKAIKDFAADYKGQLLTMLGTALASPEEKIKILKANNPDVKVRQDEKGNYFATSAANGKEYVIKPGLRATDAPQIMQTAAAFTPAGRAEQLAVAGIGKLGPTATRLLAGGATQAAVEGSQALAGGEFNAEQVPLAAGANAIAGAIPGAAKKVATALDFDAAALEARNTAARAAAAERNLGKTPAPPTSFADVVRPLEAVAEQVGKLTPKQRWVLKNVPFVGKALDGIDDLVKILKDEGEEGAKKLPKEARDVIDDILKGADETTSAIPPAAAVEEASTISAIENSGTSTPLPATNPGRVSARTPPTPQPPPSEPTAPVSMDPTQTATAPVSRLPPPTEGLEPTEVISRAAPVETPVISPAARRARLNDDEVATLLKSTAREHGTLDAATLASKAGLSSSQVTRALPKIATRRFAAEIEAIAAAKAPAPSAKPPAADLLEGIAAQNKGGKVTPVTLRQEAAVQREAAQAVTIGDFADKLLKSKDRGAFLRMLKKEKGVDFAHKVAKAAGVSTKGI